MSHDLGDMSYDLGDVSHDLGDVSRDLGDVSHDLVYFKSGRKNLPIFNTLTVFGLSSC